MVGQVCDLPFLTVGQVSDVSDLPLLTVGQVCDRLRPAASHCGAGLRPAVSLR
jgi:hypothetical protein